MKRLLLIQVLLVVVGFSYAQTKRHLNEIVVEAKAETNAIQEQKNAVPAKIVISAKDLNNFGHHTVGDVLKRMPRIFVQGPPSFNRNIMMGGLDKQFQSVLINGNRPAGGEDYRDFKLDRIPVEMVEEIEIIYNPPAEWGADASMGVVNIKLKHAPEKQIFQANVAIDHTSTHDGINPDMSLTYGDNYGKLSFIAGYSYNQFKRENITTLSEGDLSGTEEELVDVKIHGFNGTLNYAMNKNNKLTFETFFSNYAEDLDFIADIKRRSEGSLNTTADTARDNKLRRIHTQNLSWETKGENWTWRNALNLAQSNDTKNRWRMTAKSAGLTESLEDEDQENTETVLRSDYRLTKELHAFKAGIRGSGLWRDYSRLVYERIAGHKFWDDITDGSYSLDEFRIGAYLSDEITLGKFFVMPSVRLDYDTRSFKTVTESGDFEYTSFNPSLHAKYQFTNSFSVKADAAQQLARPPFNAQVPVDKIKHKKSTIERGNAELKPSLAYNFSGGVEKYFAENNYISLRGFYSIMRDVIEKKNVGVDPEYGYQIIQSVNVDSGLVWGIDIDTRFKLLNYKNNELAFMGNVSFLGSEVRDASTGNLRRLNEQPEWMGNASLDYLNTNIKLQCSLGVNFVGKRYIAGGTDEGTLIAPLVYQPFSQWDARIKYFFKPWGSIFVNAVNIFDEKTVTTQGAVTESEVVGRNLRIGINFTL